VERARDGSEDLAREVPRLERELYDDGLVAFQ
jgi:hypothetical protein